MSFPRLDPIALLTAEFACFVAGIFGLYWIVRPRLRPPVLLAASIIFYLAWNAKLLGLLLAMTAINHLIVRHLADPLAVPHRRRKLLQWGIVLQCGLLFTFKYFNFFVGNVQKLLDQVGVGHVPLMLNVVVPLGLSYFCLKAIAILVDAYQGRLPAAPTFMEHAIYLLFFASLTAGPIDRPRPFMAQLAIGQRMPPWASLRRGGDLILVGCLKKVVIANNLAGHVDRAFAGDFGGLGEASLAAVMYAFFIYADFSGYTDIARGLAACAGLELTVNFRRPYGARNPSEFWQRWHISLSTWLRDYIFLPLGGAFGSLRRAYANLIVTMVVAGLWHGASWLFLLWGLYFGLLLVAHRMLQSTLKRVKRALHLRGTTRRVVETGLTFGLTSMGWLLFRGESLHQVGTAFTGGFAVRATAWRPFLGSVVPLIVFFLALEIVVGNGQEPRLLRLPRLPWWARPVILSAALYAIFILGAQTRSFVYEQF